MIKVRTLKIEGGNTKTKWSPIWTLRRAGRNFIKIPFFRKAEPFLRHINAVTLPSDNLFINAVPRQMSTTESRSITVISANLWHDFPRFRRLHQRIDDFADLASHEKADIVLLQEASRTRSWDVTRRLADRLNMAFVYVRANGDHQIGFEEGLAVLSRFPIRNQQLIPLSQKRDGFVHRLALAAEVETPWGMLTAVSAHLSVFSKPNKIQFTALQQAIAELSTENPVILGGDFNADEINTRIPKKNLTLIDTFRAVNGNANGITHILRLPWGSVLKKRRLDYIFLNSGIRGIKILDVHHYFDKLNPLSDHAFVIARFAPVNIQL